MWAWVRVEGRVGLFSPVAGYFRVGGDTPATQAQWVKTDLGGSSASQTAALPIPVRISVHDTQS